MKKIILLLLPLLTFSIAAKAQIRNIFVETYYVSDSLDATDTINGSERALPRGSKTYRVYVQLDRGYKLKKIYGTTCNPMMIKSTTDFFNNIDRPTAYFGYQLSKSWFTGNPTLALDSWLTLGLAAKGTGSTKYAGVLKPDDTDGSIIGGTFNTGGTAGIPGGMLVNNDPAAGIPVTSADGMMTDTRTYTTWLDNGFRDASGVTDTSIFGSVHNGPQFISNVAFLQQNSGVKGDSLSGNKILVAQLTTTGELSFQFNVELIDSVGHTLNFIPESSCSTLTHDTAVSGFLKYPAACGCQDPNFLEYSANYSCSNIDSCHTRIVFGCMDTLACNYDPRANYHIQYLCCYPGLCADRDISAVCPQIAGNGGFQLFPNPASEHVTLQFSAGDSNPVKYDIYDAYGIIVAEKDFGVISGSIAEEVNIADLRPGIYLARIFIGNTAQSKTFMKN